MAPRVLLLIAVTVVGALNTSTSDPSYMEGATMFVRSGSDTTAYADRGDLRILDTIHASALQPTTLPDPMVIHLGGDTGVRVNLTTFPPFSLREGQVTAGQPASGGMRLAVNAFAWDASQRDLHFRRFNYSSCPVELKLFRAPSRRGRPVWNSRLSRDTLSCPRFQSHDSTQFDMVWPVRGILGDTLPAARYYSTIALHLADGRVLETASDSSYLTADSSPPTHDLSAVRFRASTAVVGLGPRSLRTKVVVTNISRGLVELDYGSCALSVNLFAIDKPSAAAVWRSTRRGPRRRPFVNHAGYGCTSELRIRILAPADSDVFEVNIPLAEILADSLAFGRYRAEANLGLLNKELRVPDWKTETKFDLGEVAIAPSPDSMPRTRTVDGLRYTAASRLISGKGGAAGTVRTMVLITNPTTRPITGQFIPDCPVIVYAFRNKADRDSLPLGRPAWAGDSGCPYRLGRFEVKPGQRLLVHVDKPIAPTGGEIRPGRYYILAWFGGKFNALLNAGAVDVGR